MFEVKRITPVATGLEVLIKYRRYSQRLATEETKIFATEGEVYNYIETRISDFAFWQLRDIIAELKYRCRDNDPLTLTCLEQLTVDMKYILKLPHLERCAFIMEHMIINIESAIPKKDGYARIHLTWAVDDLKWLIGFELHWKKAA